MADYLSGKHTIYDGSVLQRFYESWRPETLARFVGVVADERAPLSRPVIVGDMPWDPYRNIDELLRERDVYELDRLAKFGRARNGRHGYDYFGPTSPALGEYRFKKHCRVAQSIVDEGFDPSVHIIDVQLFTGGSSSGAHRPRWQAPDHGIGRDRDPAGGGVTPLDLPGDSTSGCGDLARCGRRPLHGRTSPRGLRPLRGRSPSRLLPELNHRCGPSRRPDPASDAATDASLRKSPTTRRSRSWPGCGACPRPCLWRSPRSRRGAGAAPPQ